MSLIGFSVFPAGVEASKQSLKSTLEGYMLCVLLQDQGLSYKKPAT